MIAEQLNELVQGGKAFQFGPSGRGKHPRFWSRSEASYAEHVILGIVASAPMKWSDVEKKAKPLLKGFSARQWNELKKEMLESGKLFEVPPLLGGKAALLSSEPFNLSVYVQDAMIQCAKHLSKYNVTIEQIHQAARMLLSFGEATPPGSPLPALILEQMVEVHPGAVNGALVRLRELRRAMVFKNIEKGEFDRAVLHLADAGKVALHRHDYPAGLSEQDRAELVTNGTGVYFGGIALRS
jgi:hypothetical protein